MGKNKFPSEKDDWKKVEKNNVTIALNTMALTIALTIAHNCSSNCLIVYMAHHFILLRFNPFDLRVDMEGWWFEHSYVIVSGLLVVLHKCTVRPSTKHNQTTTVQQFL